MVSIPGILLAIASKYQTVYHQAFVYRVDEFKQQLYFLHQNIASNSKKTQELQENAQQLATLFHKIDQIEVLNFKLLKCS